MPIDKETWGVDGRGSIDALQQFHKPGPIPFSVDLDRLYKSPTKVEVVIMFFALRDADDAALPSRAKTIGNRNKIELVGVYHFDSIKDEEIVRLEMFVQQIFNSDLYQKVYFCFRAGVSD